MVFLMEVPWHGRAPTFLLLTTLFSGTFRKSWRSMRFFLVRKPPNDTRRAGDAAGLRGYAMNTGLFLIVAVDRRIIGAYAREIPNPKFGMSPIGHGNVSPGAWPATDASKRQ
jgi:hypothetical protein